MIIEKLFKTNRVIGLVGNQGEAKSTLALSELIKLKEQFKIPIYVLGVESSLYNYLEKKGIIILKSKEDILDLKINNSVIYIDECGDIFDTKTSSRELNKIKRFFNRIDHLNDFLLISSAVDGFYNKFMEGLIKSFIVKKIDYQMLVNGTLLKRKVMAITENTSEYRLDVPKDTFYVITQEEIVEKCNFEYDENLDSKKGNINPFLEKNKKPKDLNR